MARNKNSTALFDAIYSAKKPPKASPSAAIPTPKWFAKNKIPAKPPAVESTENVGKQKSWLSRAKQNGVQSVPATAPTAAVLVPVPLVTESVVETVPVVYSQPTTEELPAVESVDTEIPEIPRAEVTRPRFIDRFVKSVPKPESVEAVAVEAEAFAVESTGVETVIEPAVPTEAVVPVEPEIKPQRRPTRPKRESFVSIDSAAREFRFSLSYAGLVAMGFIFVMALAIAFIVGTRTSLQVAADDETPVQKEPSSVHPTGMLAAVGPIATVDPVDSSPIKPDVLLIPQHPQRDPVPAAANTPGPTTLPVRNTRDIGMIYVIVQSYPKQEMAQKACDFLNHEGVACTVVQGPSDWALNDWYSVIGLQPFNKHDPALPEYERMVKSLGMKFTDRVPDQFYRPQGYTWRADSDLSQQ